MRFHGGKWSGIGLDFSVNLNPLAPKDVIHSAICECIDERAYLRYPDYDYVELRRAVGKFYGADPSDLVMVNGAAEALSLIVLALRPKSLVVTCPSYGEYEQVCGSLRISISYAPFKVVNDEFVLNLELLAKYCRESTIIIINNPNNPTGSLVPRGELFELLGWRRCYVVLDEAYAELCDAYPVELPKELPTNFIIVRTFTKWLSVPGLRVGFMYLTGGEIRELLDSVRQPWNVSSTAECVIKKLLTRHSALLKEVIAASRKYLSEERPRLSNLLRSIGLDVFKSYTNFLLVRKKGADFRVINDYLVSRYGMAIRPCIGFRGLGREYARISIRLRKENEALVSALKEVLSSGRA